MLRDLRAILDKNLIRLFAVLFLDGLSIGAMAALLPILFSAKGVGSVIIGWLYSASGIAIVLVSLKVMAISKKFGHGNAINFSAIMLALLAVVLYAWQVVWVWLVVRLVAGIFIGIRWIGNEVWINNSTHDRHRGRVMAMYVGVYTISVSLGSALIAPVAHHDFIPFLFIIMVLLTSIIFVKQLKQIQPIFDNTKVRLWHCIKRHRGVFAVGLASGLLYGLTPMLVLQGKLRGWDEVSSGFVISLFMLGPALLTWQAGQIIDKFNKKRIIIGAAMIIMMAAVPAMLLTNYWWAMGFTAILGVMDFVIYSTTLALFGNLYKNTQLMEINSAFVLVFEIATIIGAPLAGFMMELLGIWGLAVFTILVGMIASLIFLEKELYTHASEKV